MDDADILSGKTPEESKYVELLKKNYDVILEKYEVYRQRNEQLEQTADEKDKLYREIK